MTIAQKTKTAASPDTVEPIKQSAEEQKIQADEFKNAPTSQAGSKNEIAATPRESWLKRLVRWILQLLF